MQKKVIVIGGGFAGLSTAAYLAKNNFKVTILEASPKLGGRAYSFFDSETKTVIDNGQHILMGCYYETISFLSLIGASENFYFQKKLKVDFVQKGFKVHPLKSFPFFYPFNLIFGFLNFGAISVADRLSALRVLIKLPFYTSNKFSQLSIKEWLKKENQSESVQNAFWKILAVGALNTSLEKASAKIFIDILKQIFLEGNKSAKIVLPKKGLSESYVANAREFILNSGGDIRLSEQVDSIFVNNNRVSEIQTSKAKYTDFDYVVSAIPAFALERILKGESNIRLPDFESSTILNIHIWLKKNVIPEGFFGLIDSPVHWVFNKGTHINIVISDANEFTNKSDDNILELLKGELKKYFLLDSELISKYKVIKEKRATFIPSKEIINNRPSQKTNINNLVLAGDWVDTGLPSTIESAVKSGRVASEIVSSLN
jgi:squalene-associated FAD-dependent desaturase